MRVGVIGLGYVGLPLVVAFGEEGHEVTGVDSSGSAGFDVAQRHQGAV